MSMTRTVAPATGSPSWPPTVPCIAPVATPGAATSRGDSASARTVRLRRNTGLAGKGPQLVEPVEHDDDFTNLRPTPDHQKLSTVGVDIIRRSVRDRHIWAVIEEDVTVLDRESRGHANCRGHHPRLAAVEQLAAG